MADKLDMNALNDLPMPLIATFCGGNTWPIYDIDVQTGLVRIDVCGLLEIKHFCEVTKLTDGDHQEHDAERFWL